MNLQLEIIYRQRTTQELHILTMDEHPGNDQGQTAERKTRSKDAWWKGTEAKQRKRQKRPRTEAHIRGKKGHYCGPCCFIMAEAGRRVQPNIRRFQNSFFQSISHIQ